jgi:hypothetical protein
LGQIQSCSLDELAGGDSAETMLNLPAPFIAGTYRSLLFAGASDRRVCKDGTNAGDPCSDDTDCTGGSMGSCAGGVCVDNTTQAAGEGCDTTADCGANETCVQCDTSQPGMILLPFDCAQTTVFGHLAPAMSPWAIAGSVLMLLALAFFGMRRFRTLS